MSDAFLIQRVIQVSTNKYTLKTHSIHRGVLIFTKHINSSPDFSILMHLHYTLYILIFYAAKKTSTGTTLKMDQPRLLQEVLMKGSTSTTKKLKKKLCHKCAEIKIPSKKNN